MATILIADDSDLFVALETQPALRSGSRLVAVRSGPELVTRASTVAPDLILLDADLIGAGLRSCLRSLKADRKLRGVPLVIAATSPDAFNSLIGAGDAVFQKPVSPEVVGEALRRLLPVARRTSRRVPVSVSVLCRIGGQRVTLRSKDLAVGGLFLKTPRDLPCGTRFEATFSLPDPSGAGLGARPISALCEVVRRVGPEETDLISGVAATFVRIGEEDAGALRRFVDERAA